MSPERELTGADIHQFAPAQLHAAIFCWYEVTPP